MQICIRTQTHSHSDSLALRLSRAQFLVIIPIVFVRVVHPAMQFGALARLVAPSGAPPNKIFTTAVLTTADGQVLRQANQRMRQVTRKTRLVRGRHT
eukprot:9069839-Pyramimonas_sp.AAC.1